MLFTICVVTMYIDSSTVKGKRKSYTRHLLRNSFRENGKVKHKTIANLSHCSEEEIQAIKLALRHKKNLSALISVKDVNTALGKRIGAVWAFSVVAERLGITMALGRDRNGKLGLLQVLARMINQGSRLSAVRLAQSHALCECIGVDKLDEDDLYENLAWLHERQEEIEKKLYKRRFSKAAPTLFLYDVTSSYLEGVCNELADWGYSRDKKKGKMQIVVGMLAGPDGLPVAVRVFRGNTSDTQTVSEQVRILAENFGVKEVTIVGDRGMLKGPQIDSLPDNFRYITAITKPQILKMFEDRILQYDLFTEDVCEVEENGIRYILRRNPLRAEQISLTRQRKYEAVQKLCMERNKYLAEHPKASVDAAMKKVISKIKKLRCEKWLFATVQQRVIAVGKDEDALEQVALLDGCYVIKSDVPRWNAETQTLHDRYCDLETVERAFRTMKTVHLELRPVYVRKEASTKGHVFVLMLGLLVQRELEKYWADLDVTVEEAIDELASIHMEDVHIGDKCIRNIPIPTGIGKKLLEKAGITLPSMLPSRTANVHTKKKLQPERIQK
ncbi:MAG: IS1634 family transposase [Thermodesulfobacteriota bacterium]|nr:IS1634 family transposase [Thermodesulfobacteriota bacterium]